jgi:hypothetical protein
VVGGDKEERAEVELLQTRREVEKRSGELRP